MSLFDDLVNPTKPDLEAIYAYVRAQRPAAKGKPKALAIIVDFESWYQGLGLTDAALDNETLKEAKRRRSALNDALGEKLPDDYVPVDAPQTPPPRDEVLDAVKEGVSTSSSQLVTLAKAGVAAAVGIVLVNLWRKTR